jgi:hypothetical protein
MSLQVSDALKDMVMLSGGAGGIGRAIAWGCSHVSVRMSW